MNSFPFRILRRLGSVPSVLILTGLLIGGISAGQAVAEFFSQPVDQFVSVQSALNGGK